MADPRPRRGAIDGVLVVDKPRGPTSHDVVARLRRLLGERRIGHAGTLDPMATGVLVILLGEGTKLAPYLTAADKRYVAQVTFGAATSTLDAEGEVTARADVPADLVEEIRTRAPAGRIAAAIREEIARVEQVPPAFSAIQIDGERSHDLAREGRAVALSPRPVAVRRCAVVGSASEPPSIELDVAVSKGYYVRSLARDLGERLGVPSHLSQLRRTESGAFTLAEAVALDAGSEAVRAAVQPIVTAVRRAIAVAVLTDDGAVRARQGKRLTKADFRDPPPEGAGPFGWLDASDRLVAIGEARAADDGSGSAFVVLRGFSGPAAAG